MMFASKKILGIIGIMLIAQILLASDDPDAGLIEKAGSLQEQGKYNEAIKIYDEILKKYPNSEYADDALWNKISIYSYAFNDTEKEYLYCQLLIKKYPKSEWAEEALRAMAFIVFEKGDYLKAIELNKEFLAKYPRSQWVFERKFDSAWAYKELKEYDNSIKEAQELIKDFPNNHKTPMLYIFIGNIYMFDLNNLDASEKTFLELLEKYPDSSYAAEGLDCLMNVYQDQGKWEKARDALNRFLINHPNYKDTLKIKEYLKSVETRIK